MAVEKRRLGKTDIEITPLGLGSWQFHGGKGFGRFFWKSPPQEEVNKIIRTALDGGINWFDTAEAYGSGNSEKALATALGNAGKVDSDVVIATKWSPMFRTARNIHRTISDRTRYLAPFSIDLYQVHFPSSFSSIEKQMDAMADLVREEKIRSVGVSNFSAEQMRQAHAALAKHGLPLASNQVRFNLLDRRVEKEGVLDAARELNMTVIAYSPLAQGLLTGKFHKGRALVKKLPLYRKRQARRNIEKSLPLVTLLEEIAASYNCTPSVVALSWVINYLGDTIVAIAGASRAEQALQNVGAMNLKLSKDEMEKLDVLSRDINS
jgi:aryl-alcohol dehydrogenase-like predicted oxidoreductase